jgi:hypothetical protein
MSKVRTFRPLGLKGPERPGPEVSGPECPPSQKCDLKYLENY